jgi:hypothetical protein
MSIENYSASIETILKDYLLFIHKFRNDKKFYMETRLVVFKG